jgi:hypothetical protein
LLCRCVAGSTAAHGTVSAAVSSSSRAAAVATQEFDERLWCCLMTRRAARASLSRCCRPRTMRLRVVVCRCPWCARLCVCSTSRLSNAVVLLFFMRVTRDIHLSFAFVVAVVVAVIVVVWRALVLTSMASLSPRFERARVSPCRWLVRSDDGVGYLWAVWLSHL